MADCIDPNCVHCAVSQLLLQRQPLALPADACLIGQVLADIVASVPDIHKRVVVARTVRDEIDRMLGEAVEGTWQQQAREETVHK